MAFGPKLNQGPACTLAPWKPAKKKRGDFVAYQNKELTCVDDEFSAWAKIKRKPSKAEL